jgi:hypothetical protein
MTIKETLIHMRAIQAASEVLRMKSWTLETEQDLSDLIHRVFPENTTVDMTRENCGNFLVAMRDYLDMRIEEVEQELADMKTAKSKLPGRGVTIWRKPEAERTFPEQCVAAYFDRIRS